MNDFEMAKQIAKRVAAEGGGTFFVGGYVRDILLGRENKDVDIEIHGITPGKLEAILDSLGERTVMGVSFGIYGLRHFDLDIAMPRKETANGRRHKDFDVFVDPFLGTRKAAMRRDFTMNALMQDVLTGEIIDHFGGIEDIRSGIIRHVNDETFVEDALRVLRAAQFAARFDFDVAEETRELSKMMDLSVLARERIAGELEKALLKAERPSVFFEELRQMNQLHVWFPELEALIGIEQEKRWHPEGDVWDHTMLVLDAAASLRRQAEYPLGLMYAALCHDLGKAVSTEQIDGRIRAFGHEITGQKLAKQMLGRITSEIRLGKYVQNMVKMHMRPNLMAREKSGRKAMTKMFDQSVCPDDLLLLAKCDRMGQLREEAQSEEETFLRMHLALFKERMAQPYVMGADLVALGYTPCKEFKLALDYAHKLRLAGVRKDHALVQTAAYMDDVLRKRKSEEQGL